MFLVVSILTIVVLQDLIKECDQQKSSLDRCKGTSKSLLEAAAIESRDVPISDQDSVKEEVKFLAETYQNVSEKLADLRKQCENIEKELNLFYEKGRALNEVLEEVDDVTERKITVSTLPEKCAQTQQTLKVNHCLVYERIYY